MVPSSIGPYRIIEGLGSGANGEVYLAEDTRLGRKVAVKTLVALGSSDRADARRWVLREARAAARLNHPNIASVYDVLESPSGAHIVMEYVRGETLAARVREGRLGPGRVLEIAIQLADALAEAHALGVIHRDLKPANVMITPKHTVKILDFGLAQVRAVESSNTAFGSSSEFGLEGQLIGTPPYMPPEHLRGAPFDARGDVYCLGVMLFELLTGRRPFLGPDANSLAVAILTEPTPHVRSHHPAVPPEIDEVVFRAMSRAPEERYPSAAELAADLRWTAAALEGAATRGTPRRTILGGSRTRWLAAAGAIACVFAALPGAPPPRGAVDVSRASIAVLPMKNLSPDPDNEYFSDGITEDIAVQLSKIRDLKVISAASAAAYKNTQKSSPEIGKELGVRTILQGSVRRDGNRVRIVSQLADVGTNEQLWAATYDRDLKDIFAIQSDVAGKIATALKGELSPVERARLDQRRADDPELFALYLKGRYYWNKRTEDGLRRSIALFQEAIDANPGYAPAFAGLADSYIALGAKEFLPRALARARARAAADEALKLDDRLADAQASLALVKHEELDWAGAEAGYRRAIELNPNYAAAHHWYAILLVQTGRADEAIAEIRLAQELDPLSLAINSAVGVVLALARRYDAAIGQLRATVEMDPAFAPAHGALGEAYTYAAAYDSAASEIRKAAVLSPGTSEYRASLGYVHAVSGRRDEAQKILAELTAARETAPVAPGGIAAIYAGLGDHDRAFAWLEKAYDERDMWVAYLKVEPKLERLHADPRFAALLRKVGLGPGPRVRSGSSTADQGTSPSHGSSREGQPSR